jgi:hypothetical protein
MRSVAFSALLLALAVAGFSSSASAQVRTEPPGKLFFEGDLVRHRLDGQQGPWCVLSSRYKRGEAVAWRVRAQLPNGAVATDTEISSMVVELGSGDQVPLDYGPHGNPPTDYFWANSWTVPDSYPTGSLGYKVIATMADGSTVTWEPFTRPASVLTIIEGTPTMAAAQ